MISINLLPWREQQRKVCNNIFYGYLTIILLVISTGYLFVWFSYYNDINKLRNNNNYLTHELNLLHSNIDTIQEKITTNKSMLKKILAIEQIKSRRKYLLPILTDLSKVLPGNIFLTNLVIIGRKLELSGLSHNNNMLTKLTNNIQALPWCETVELSAVTNANFKLQIIIC